MPYEAYAPDDPAICNSFDWERLGQIFAVFSLLFTLSITTSNVMILWFWVLATIHIGALGYGAWCYIKRLIPTEITWDTSEITEDDVQRFMLNKPLRSEIYQDNKKEATKILTNFISRTGEWERTDKYHFHWNGIKLFFGHKKLKISESWKTEGTLDCDDLELKYDDSSLSKLLATAKDRQEQLQKVNTI